MELCDFAWTEKQRSGSKDPKVFEQVGPFSVPSYILISLDDIQNNNVLAILLKDMISDWSVILLQEWCKNNMSGGGPV